MADRTIKPDDGNDLVLQNNDGSAKLELNEDQKVKVTTGSDAGEDFTVNTSQLVVEGDTGRVGVGNSAPTNELTIGPTTPGADVSNAIEMRGSAGDSSLQRFQIHNDGANGKTELKLGRGGSAPSSFLTIGPTNTTLNQGNLVINTAGQGIDFSNATDHTTSESSVGSVLDDYEEGDWTPTLSNSGSATVTFAKYRKIGNMVTVWARLGDLNCPSYSATTLTVSAPVATISTDEYIGGSIMGNQINRSGMLTCSPYIYLNNFYFYFTVDSSGGWSTLKWSDFNTSGSTDLFFCATYPCQ